MKVKACLAIVFVVAASSYFTKEVEGRSSSRKRGKWGKPMADAVMRPWERFLQTARGPSYKYWHYRKDSNGQWHKRKYGHSDSDESISKSYESSRSSSGSYEKWGTKRRHSTSRSRSESGSWELKSKLPANFTGLREKDSMPVVAASFIFFIDNHGCSNVTGFQQFMASYAKEVEGDETIKPNKLLKEISFLAQEELNKGTSSSGAEASNCCKASSPKNPATT